MKILENESLKKYTTIKIGGIAERMYIPSNVEELEDILRHFSEKKYTYWVLGGGSNLIINDQKIFNNVISTAEFAKQMEETEEGLFYIGASVRIQKLIQFINEKGYGGIEYLYSVPGTIGGAVMMNAGRGKRYNQAISDYIVKVDCIDEKGIKYCLTKSECRFCYRNSIFKEKRLIITGVYFEFIRQEKEILEKKRNERIEHCRREQDNSKPNCGSLLKQGNKIILRLLRLGGVGYKNGIHFSRKCDNWIINEGEGTFEQVTQLIHISQKLHKYILCEQQLEVILWY